MPDKESDKESVQKIVDIFLEGDRSKGPFSPRVEKGIDLLVDFMTKEKISERFISKHVLEDYLSLMDAAGELE